MSYETWRGKPDGDIASLAEATILWVTGPRGRYRFVGIGGRAGGEIHVEEKGADALGGESWRELVLDAQDPAMRCLAEDFLEMRAKLLPALDLPAKGETS